MRVIIFLALAFLLPNTAFSKQPANSYVSGSNWYCNSGYVKRDNKCVSVFDEIGGQPANSYVSGSNWYCNSGYRKLNNKCVSVFDEIGGQNNPTKPNSALQATEKRRLELEKAKSKQLEAFRAEAEQAKREKAELEAQLAAVQQAQVRPVSPVGPALSVHAIVVGNGAYQGSGRLDNPINDARAMSAKLRQMGFKVTTIENATRSKLVSALVGFNRSASATDVSMFFYAGHAAQISGINYMLPTDINMNDLSEVPLHGISLNSVIDQYLPGKTKLVFLDACRDNPLLQVASRSMTRGLAPISVSEGVMIAYATKDGSVAADGNGKNSPFTKALLQHIDGPDDISVVLRKVRAEVMQDTDGKQQPWDYNSLTGGSLILSAIRAK